MKKKMTLKLQNESGKIYNNVFYSKDGVFFNISKYEKNDLINAVECFIFPKNGKYIFRRSSYDRPGQFLEVGKEFWYLKFKYVVVELLVEEM
ncbi:MAG: hypothetical protein N2517_09315 [Ignavibacteria bacterium]|nr:hypothetical protein [Ignavibacteria bacterium]